MFKKSLGFLWLFSTLFVFESFGADGGWRGDSWDEEEFPERAAPAGLALAGPAEVRREIWELDQIIAELEKVFITEEPFIDSDFFNKTIRNISAHILLPEARFRSLFTELSKSLEGDFYTHLYGPRPSFSLEEVAKSTHTGLYVLTLGGVSTLILYPEQTMYFFGLGGATISTLMIISFITDAGKYCFDHVRNGMQWDYRGWCCGSKGCCRPNEDDIGEASDLSKFVSILTIALNAEALVAMSNEDAIKAMKGEVTLSLKSREIDGGEKLSLKEYFLNNSLYLLLS